MAVRISHITRRLFALGVAIAVNLLGVLFLSQLSRSSTADEAPTTTPTPVSYEPLPEPEPEPPLPEPEEPLEVMPELAMAPPAAPALTAPDLPSPSTAPMAALPTPFSPTASTAQAASSSSQGGKGEHDGLFDNARPPEIKQVEDVDQPPGVLSRTQPRYPREAARRGVTGYVQLRILISARGEIERVEVIAADPPGVFDAVATEAIRSWRFEPAQDEGKPVRVWVRKRFDFSLGAKAPERSDPKQQVQP